MTHDYIDSVALRTKLNPTAPKIVAIPISPNTAIMKRDAQFSNAIVYFDKIICTSTRHR